MSHSNDSAAAKRIRSVLDPDSFVELGAFVTARSTDFNLSDRETPGDGVVTGYGTVEGRLVYVYSQNADVLGGSVGEMHAKKIIRLYKMAVKMGAPVLGLIDCAGLRLEEATDALSAFGALYRAKALASGVIPQVLAVFGSCGGSLAVSAAMADFTFVEQDCGKLFIHSANAVAGCTDKDLDNASAAFQAEKSGVADFTGSEEDVYAGIKELLSVLPSSFEEEAPQEDTEDSLNRLLENAECMDADALLAAISDDGLVVEPGKDYGPTLKTAFIRLNGCTVGAVANCGEEYCWKGAAKAAKFIRFCDAFSIPVLTLVNVKGFKKTINTEYFMADAAASLAAAYASATVPKVTVITGAAHGTAGNVLGSKGLGTDLVYAWNTANIALMDAGDAVKVMYAEELEKAENRKALYDEKVAAYNALQADACAAARRGFVDDVIAPEVTRKRVIAAFEMLYMKSEDLPAKKHGTI